MQKLAKFILPLGALATVQGCKDGPVPVPEENPETKFPNVLFITMSDIGYYDFGYTGSDFYETPTSTCLPAAACSSPVHIPARPTAPQAGQA